MKNYSIYERATQLLVSTDAVDLGRISNISRQRFTSLESFCFSASAPTLEYAALMIEHEVLLRTDRGGRIYAGFERLSNLEPIIERYLRIADVSESVSIFGEPDWKPPRHPNIRYIHLNPEFNLTHEWYLIVESSIFQVGLIASADQRAGSPLSEERKFSGIKTSNPRLVSRLALGMEAVIDWAVLRNAS